MLKGEKESGGQTLLLYIEMLVVLGNTWHKEAWGTAQVEDVLIFNTVHVSPPCLVWERYGVMILSEILKPPKVLSALLCP